MTGPGLSIYLMTVTKFIFPKIVATRPLCQRETENAGGS